MEALETVVLGQVKKMKSNMNEIAETVKLHLDTLKEELRSVVTHQTLQEKLESFKEDIVQECIQRVKATSEVPLNTSEEWDTADLAMCVRAKKLDPKEDNIHADRDVKKRRHDSVSSSDISEAELEVLASKTSSSDIQKASPGISGPPKKAKMSLMHQMATAAEKKAAEMAQQVSRIPKELQDLDAVVQVKLQPFYKADLDAKQRLTPVQMAFFEYQLDQMKPLVSYKNIDTKVSTMIRAGVTAGMWPQNWEPNNIKGGFVHYMKEKVKGFIRKEIVKQHEERYKEKFDQ